MRYFPKGLGNTRPRLQPESLVTNVRAHRVMDGVDNQESVLLI